MRTANGGYPVLLSSLFSCLDFISIFPVAIKHSLLDSIYFMITTDKVQKEKMKEERKQDVEEGQEMNHFRTPTKGLGSSDDDHSPDEFISRADTFETSLSSPSTFDSVDPIIISPPKPRKISFEHHMKLSKKRKSFDGNLIFGISKPLLAITFLFLAVAGIGEFCNLLSGDFQMKQFDFNVFSLSRVFAERLAQNPLAKQRD